MRAVADTGLLRYLVPIGVVGILPMLFSEVFVPEAVHAELLHPKAPAHASVGYFIVRAERQVVILSGVLGKYDPFSRYFSRLGSPYPVFMGDVVRDRPEVFEAREARLFCSVGVSHQAVRTRGTIFAEGVTEIPNPVQHRICQIMLMPWPLQRGMPVLNRRLKDARVSDAFQRLDLTHDIRGI